MAAREEEGVVGVHEAASWSPPTLQQAGSFCLHRAESGTLRDGLVREGALVPTCRTCFLLAEATWWLRPPTALRSQGALDVLELYFAVLRANHD